MRFTHGILLIVLVMMGCAEGAGDPSSSSQWGEAEDRRVMDAYRQHGPTAIILIGDSMTAMNPLTELCGLPVINAGYPGGQWADVAARPIWSSLHVMVAIVLLGTNNAVNGQPLSTPDMQAFLQRVPADMIWLETVPNFYNPLYLTPNNHSLLIAIQDAQVQLGYPLIDTRLTLDDITLYASDGIHWNAAGYDRHNRILIETLCPSFMPTPAT